MKYNLEKALSENYVHQGSTDDRSYRGITELRKVTFSCTHFFSRGLAKNDQLDMFGKFSPKYMVQNSGVMRVSG